MSTSEIEFTVAVDPDVETFIIDSSYALLRRELGPFAGKLPPGIYKFKFRRGTAIVEQLEEIPGSSSVITPSHELEVQTALPSSRSKRSLPSQVMAARDMSHQTHLHLGSGSSIFLFVRNDSEAPPRDPAAGFTLHSIEDECLADLGELAVRDDTQSCAAFNVELTPGAYRLRYTTPGEEPIEQIVIASAGWQTQVFLLHDRVRESRVPPPPLATASVLMCRDGFNPEDEMLQLADAARLALSLERAQMPRELLQRLLTDKFDSPMLGIYAAHALAASPTPSDSLLERLIAALEGLLPDHPDVASLRLGSSPDPITLSIPPMLRSSWKRIVDASLEDKVTFAPGSLASRLPASFVAGTPWLIWQPAELLPAATIAPEAVAADLSDLESLIGASLGSEAEPDKLGLSGWEEAIYSYLKQQQTRKRREPVVTLEFDGLEAMPSAAPAPSQPEPIDDRRLARAFGTTVGHVQATVAGLAAKLKSSGTL